MSLPITRVTVAEDRAVVLREGTVTLTAGTQRVRVEDVAPALVDKSIRASVVSGDAKIGETRVVRRARAASPDDPSAQTEAEKLDAEIDAATDAEGALVAAAERVRAELRMLEAAARASLDELGWDAAHGALPAAAGLRRFEEREKELGAKVVRLDLDARDQQEACARLRARRAAAEHPATRARAALEIVVSTETAGEARIAVEYVVPGACWRPQHTATLRGEEVSLATEASVWQNTGEPWDDVELRLSTERPSLGREPPRLADDVLVAVRKQEGVHVEARDERVATAGLGGVASRARVPGIDDGGEPRVLVAHGRARVATDGRPHRVPIGAFETRARVESICLPEVASAVILRSEQANAGKGPLLAGPVDLIRQGGFVGRTQVPFVAPGERFELGWGPDPGVRVRHETEELDEDPSVLSGWLVRSVRQRVRISSLDPAKRTFSLTLRIPVSEIEKVRIAQDVSETTDRAKADADGFVRWTIELPPSGRKEIALRYEVKRKKDVVGI